MSEVKMAIVGYEVIFRHVACEIFMFCKWFEFKRRD